VDLNLRWTVEACVKPDVWWWALGVGRGAHSHTSIPRRGLPRMGRCDSTIPLLIRPTKTYTQRLLFFRRLKSAGADTAGCGCMRCSTPSTRRVVSLRHNGWRHHELGLSMLHHTPFSSPFYHYPLHQLRILPVEFVNVSASRMRPRQATRVEQGAGLPCIHAET
jgi:hypothetical protein